MSGGLTLHDIDYVEVSEDGSNWARLPGIQDVGESGGDGTTTTIRMLDGVAAISTPPGPGQITVNLGALQPHHESYRLMLERGVAGNALQYRIRTKEQEVVATTAAGITAAIDTDGDVTIAGTGAPAFADSKNLNVGLVISVGGTDYVIEEITSNTALRVSPSPATAVAAAVFSVKRPVLSKSGLADVTAIGGFSAAPGSQLSGSVVLTPQAIDEWAIM